MICKNCGAEYDSNSLKCPYCGSENSKVAEEIKEQILESYDEEARQMEVTVPKKAVRKWTKYIIRGAWILIVLIIVGIIVSLLWGRVSAGIEHSLEQKHLKKLEELFQSEDWEGLSSYIDEKDIYSREYEKYTQFYYVWDRHCRYKEDITRLQDEWEADYNSLDLKKEYCRLYSERILTDISYILREASMAIEDRALLGNEQILEEIYEESVAFLLDKGFSQDEIEEITLGGESPSWQEMTDKLAEGYIELYMETQN